jgi:hypothetical protein
MTGVLSDRVILARARVAIADLRTTTAKSLKLIAETKHLLTLIVDPPIKIDQS